MRDGTANGLMRVFWPLDAPGSDRAGVIVGWRNGEQEEDEGKSTSLDVTVVTVLQDVEVRSVQNALQVGTLFRGSPHPMSQIFDRCGHEQLQVLGQIDAKGVATAFDPQALHVMSAKKGYPPEIYCPAGSCLTLQIIMFERPDPTRMQYMSLAPISLTLGDASDPKMGISGLPFGNIEEDAEAERTRKRKLVEKLKLHTVVKHPRTEKELALTTILDQINSSWELDQLMQKNIGLVGVRSRRALSVSERVVKSATTLWDNILLTSYRTFRFWIWPILSHLFILALVAHRAVGELVLQVLEGRILPHGAALKDVSATAQQVDIRLQQFCYWPTQYLTLRRRRNSWGSITNNHAEYIRFYNSLWLVANDIIIGIALGSYIMDNADYVATLVSSVVDVYFIDGLQRMISWLMDWPAGLKLNTELAAFLGDLFLWVIEYWADCMRTLAPILPHIVRYIGLSSFVGASMPISLFSDLVSLLTIHIYCFYIASARIFNWQLTTIVSLFHLFRGKKRNMLRNRIDSCDYDLDQLLLGTILFTLLTFLLPTVAVFYSTFAGARIGIICLKAGLDIWLACLNHFPLFALMLRAKDSGRLPGGIRFELQDTPSSAQTLHDSAPTAIIKLRSIPLPLSSTFAQYFALASRIQRHYISASVLVCLLSGRAVPPIHRRSLYSMQYSMLPAKRVPVGELWRMLTSTDADGMATKRDENGFVTMNGGVAEQQGRNGRAVNGDGHLGSKERKDERGKRARSQARKTKEAGMWWSK